MTRRSSGGAAGNARRRVQDERANGNGVQANRGAQGERLGPFIVEQNSAGIGICRVGQHPHRCFQPIFQVEVSGSRAVDAAQRGQPGERGVDHRMPTRFRILDLDVIGIGERGERSSGGQRVGRIAALTASALEQILQGGDGGRHGFFEAETVAPGVGPERGKAVPQRLRTVAAPVDVSEG